MEQKDLEAPEGEFRCLTCGALRPKNKKWARCSERCRSLFYRTVDNKRKQKKVVNFVVSDVRIEEREKQLICKFCNNMPWRRKSTEIVPSIETKVWSWPGSEGGKGPVADENGICYGCKLPYSEEEIEHQEVLVSNFGNDDDI